MIISEKVVEISLINLEKLRAQNVCACREGEIITRYDVVTIKQFFRLYDAMKHR